MDEINCVLFYSKYSPACKRIMNIISDTELTLINVCVDSSDIREKLSQSNEVDIQVVPSILKIYTDGGIEKFEGSSAFKWVEEVISLITPPIQSQPMQPQPVQPQPVQPQPEQPQPEQPQPVQLNSGSTLISDLITADDETEKEEDFSQYHANTSKVTGIKSGNVMEMAMAMKDSRDSEPDKKMNIR